VTVLQRGEVLAEGSYDEVSRDARVLQAYMGVNIDDAQPDSQVRIHAHGAAA
jgi:branched-chain amino acid transport system ATP-binding protein